MAASEIEKRVTRLIDSHYNRQRIEVLPGATLRSGLRMDSLDILDLQLELEYEFDIDINDDDMEAVDCVSEIVLMIGNKLRKG